MAGIVLIWPSRSVFTSLAVRVLLLLCAWPFFARADVVGNVIGVSDGDTIALLDPSNRQHKVRLAGIDAPESRQAFGQRSKEALSECALGKAAIVEGRKVDRYGRLVGKVVVGGADCNLRQIQLGLAWHYKRYEGEQPALDRARYSGEEASAREGKRGLWKHPAPIPPWDFRRH